MTQAFNLALFANNLNSSGQLNADNGIYNTVNVANGGTNLSSTPTNGQLLIGNGTGYTLATLTGGTGITISNASGAITITNSASSGASGQVFTSSGTFTVPANITAIKVTICSGGGGGGGYSGNGSAGGSSSFGSYISATGGSGGIAGNSTGLGGAGGVVTGSSLGFTTMSGSNGSYTPGEFTDNFFGGSGGKLANMSILGGLPGASVQDLAGVAATGYGNGGGGAGSGVPPHGAGGGGSGGYGFTYVTGLTPGSTIAVTVGGGGSGGAAGSGTAGGAGSAGVVIIEW